MFKKKRKQTAQARLLVPRVALVQALARATFDGNQTAIRAATRLLALCDENGHDSLVF